MIDLNTLVKFIPVKDIAAFEDYDSCEGYCSCIYVEGGIVVANDMFERYSKFVKEIE